MTLFDLWLQPVTPTSVEWAERHAEVLDSEEARRWKRYHRQESQDLFLVAHVATRFVLSTYDSTDPVAWAFERGKNGRPELTGGPDGLRFNISHTEGMVAVLVHGESDAGVDVESPWRSTNIESVSRRVFTDDERSAMLDLPEPERAERFYQLWTLKESFIKAKGKGFAMPLSKFGFAIGDGGAIEFSCDPSLDSDASKWSYSTIWSEAGHVVSVCSHVADGVMVSPTIRSLDLEEPER